MSLPVAPHCLSQICQKYAKDCAFVHKTCAWSWILLLWCVCVCAALFKMTSHFILKATSLILEEKRLVLEEDEEGNSQTTLHQHNRNLKTAIG